MHYFGDVTKLLLWMVTYDLVHLYNFFSLAFQKSSTFLGDVPLRKKTLLDQISAMVDKPAAGGAEENLLQCVNPAATPPKLYGVELQKPRPARSATQQTTGEVRRGVMVGLVRDLFDEGLSVGEEAEHVACLDMRQWPDKPDGQFVPSFGIESFQWLLKRFAEALSSEAPRHGSSCWSTMGSRVSTLSGWISHSR